MYRILLLISAAFVAGCTSDPSETMISQNSNVSASYRTGFDDGCHSGRQAAGQLFEEFRRDQARFNSDSDYAQGWNDAFRQCETQAEALERRIRSAATISAIQSSNEKRFDNVLDGIDTSGLENL